MLTAGALGAIAGAAVMLFLEPAELFGRAPPPSGELSARGAQTAVVDGETLRVQDTVVRLLGVAAPPRGQMCHRPDGASFDCGAASAEALARMVQDRAVACHLRGHDRDGQVVAVCEADGQELNQAQVTGGWARARAELPGLGAEEIRARVQHRGLWAGRFDSQS